MNSENEEEVITDTLTEEEMQIIGTRNLEKNIRDAQQREIDLKRQMVQLKFEAAKHEKEAELLRCDNIKRRILEISAIKDKEHREYIDTLKDNYKITGNFGYKPDTGEIVRED